MFEVRSKGEHGLPRSAVLRRNLAPAENVAEVHVLGIRRTGNGGVFPDRQDSIGRETRRKPRRDGDQRYAIALAQEAADTIGMSPHGEKRSVADRKSTRLNSSH